MQEEQFRVYCVQDSARDKNHRIIDVAIPVFDEARNKVVPVLFDVKNVTDGCTNWQSAHHAFTLKKLRELRYDHFLVFYSKHKFTSKNPRKAEVGKGKISSADCRDIILSLLAGEAGERKCIIEGHELMCAPRRSCGHHRHGALNIREWIPSTEAT